MNCLVSYLKSHCNARNVPWDMHAQRLYRSDCEQSETILSSLIIIFVGRILNSTVCKCLHSNNDNSDQTERMRRLTEVLVGAHARRIFFSDVAAIHALLMQGYATFNMVFRGYRIPPSRDVYCPTLEQA